MREVQLALEEAIQVLRREALLLLKWARDSGEGGWSTHQVDPMRKRAKYLTAKADGLEVIFFRSKDRSRGKSRG